MQNPAKPRTPLPEIEPESQRQPPMYRVGGELPPMSAREMGTEYGKKRRDFEAGFQAAQPKPAPAPVDPTTRANFGVMRRGGIDPATGREFGFVGVGSGPAGSNATFDSYEKAREFSQTQRAAAGESAPYQAPVAGESRGFGAGRNVVAPPAMPARPPEPAFRPPAMPRADAAQNPASQAWAQNAAGRGGGQATTELGFSMPTPAAPMAPAPVAVDPTPRPAATPSNATNAAAPRLDPNRTLIDDLRTVGRKVGEATGFVTSEKRKAQHQRAKAAMAARQAQPTMPAPDARTEPDYTPAGQSPFRMPSMEELEEGIISDPFDFPSVSPTGRSRARTSLA